MSTKARYPIDLGRTMGESSPASPSKRDKKKKFYPSFYVEWDKKYDLPDSGTMTVKFQKTSETTSKRPGDKEHQSVTLDILEIIDTKAGKVSDGEKELEEESGSDALDRMKKDSESESKEKDDYE